MLRVCMLVALIIAAYLCGTWDGEDRLDVFL